MFWDDEPCSAHDVGGNLGGPCNCTRCEDERNHLAPSTKWVCDECGTELDHENDPCECEEELMSYNDRAEFSRLKAADVEQGKRIAELLDDVTRYAKENARLRQSVELLSHEPADVTLACQGNHGDMSRKALLRLLPHMVPRSQYSEVLKRIAELEAEVERLRRAPWEGHWS